MLALPALPADLAALAHDLMAANDVPGMAVGLLHDGRFDGWGFGIASLETRTPVTAGTLFQWGSISKVFTATLILQLVDRGRLELDTPIVSYLPELQLAEQAATRSVTLRHLLTHTSGIYGDRFEDYGHGDDALARAIAEFHTLPQWTVPGTTWAYCNTGFQLAGRVAEAVLGVPFETAMYERVLNPLRMDRTFYFAHEAITYPVAVGHNRLPGQAAEVAHSWGRSRARAPQGGLTGTVSDLLRFAAMHLADGVMPDGTPVLSATSARLMRVPQVATSSPADAYGLAWQLRRSRDGWIVGHGGSTNGFRAALAMAPEQRAAVAVLTNGSDGFHVTRAVEDWALARFGGGGPVLPPVAVVAPATLLPCAGRYTRPDNDIDVTVTDGGLSIHLVKTDPFTRVQTDWPPMRALPLGDARFLGQDGLIAGEALDFLGGSATGFTYLRLDGRLHRRIGAVPPA